MPWSTAASSSACSAGEALASTARPKPSPEPTAGWAASGPPSARGDDPARLLDDQRGGRDVVREVRADRAVARPRGTCASSAGQLVDDAAADVDVRVELAGDDARHVERRRAEVEVAAAHRRAVDQLLEHDRHRQRPGGRAARRSRTARRDRCSPDGAIGIARAVGALGARALAARREEAVAGLDLVHDAERHVAERRVASTAARPRPTRSTTRARPPRAGCRRSGRRRGSRAGAPNAT